MGGIISGIGQIALGLDQASSRNAVASQQFNRKRLESQIGQYEEGEKGAIQAQQLRQTGTQLIARQRTAYTNSGVDASQGTAADVMADTRLMSETDALRAENNAARKVRGHKEQLGQAEENYFAQVAENDRAGTGSMLSGAGSIISGGVGMFGG